MKDLISRQAVIESIDEYFDDLPIQRYYDMVRMIENLPAIDAVPVVRCKDCKYYKESVVLSPNKFCFRMKDRYGEAAIGYNFAEDDFCSYGERRELPDAESEIDKWWDRSETVNAERGEE